MSDGAAVGAGGADVPVRGPLGFTALTEAHGDEQAADLIGGFCGAVRQLLVAHQAQEGKTIGDALDAATGDAAAGQPGELPNLGRCRAGSAHNLHENRRSANVAYSRTNT